MEQGIEQTERNGAGCVEVTLVFRHFHPILAGAAERFRRYSVPLAKADIGYDVFTLREDEKHAAHEQLHDRLSVRRIAATGAPWQRDEVLFTAAWGKLSQLTPRGHVLQTSLAHDLSTPWVRRTRKHGVGCLYVGTMVGREEEGLPAWRRWVQKWKNRRNYQAFDRVVASTTVMAQWFQECGAAADRIDVIPNGVDVERFQPVASAEQKRQLRTTLQMADAPTVVFAGSIVPRKGVDLLIRCWPKVLAQVPDARLILVGGFERPTFMTQERMQELSRFQEGVRGLAAQPECRGSITFAGESSRVEDWFQAADAFVFPTEQEGMGNVVLEAMACAVPCVITQFHGLPKEEFGEAGREFVLVPRTEDALADGLSETLKAPEKARIMGLRGCEWTRDRMDVRLTIARYAKLYRQLARRSD
jgi:glycosyltransferase involved in cell wall biosynthesis